MSSSTPTGTGRNPRDDRSVGAYRLGEPAPKRRAAWLIPLLALLALALVAFLLWLFLHGDKTKAPAAAAAATASATVSPSVAATPSADVTTAAPTPALTTAAAGTGAGAVAGAGTLLAGGQTVLPPTGQLGNLSKYAGKPVTAKGVTVQSVPADEGFWVGSSAADRVWVQLTGTAGESAYQVKKGDHIDFTGGKVVPTAAGFARSAGVTAAEGAAQLTAQRQHVSLAKSAVHLSS